jgi:WD40 repeat protein
MGSRYNKYNLPSGDALAESGEVRKGRSLHSSRPRIFISYARRDGQRFADSLRRRLEDGGFGIWQDIASMEGGRDWWEQISKAIKQVEYLVMVMTPGALASRYTAMEWKLARQEGTCVLPVFGGEEIDLSKLPRWMRHKHFVDTTISEQWTRFIRTLEGPCQTERVPFMADDLPEDFVARPDELEEAMANLLREDRAKPVGITALYGGGGFGKTTLACAICHDERIQDAFDDGVLWVTLGETPGNPIAQLEDLVYVLSRERPSYTTMDAASARFRELLEGRDILIVIDDVWDSSHLHPFLQGGSRCARLITTRNSDTLPAGSSNLKLESMTPREAVKLLAAGLDAEQVSALSSDFGKLAERLGEWPLLLKLVNGALRKRIEGYKQPVLNALNDANQALTRRGLIAFDKKNSQQRSDAVAKTIGLSIALLEGSERERYQELAVFPEDLDIPLAAVEKLWGATAGLDPFESKDLCERVADLSLLLKFDLTGSYIRLHDVFRQYLIGLHGDRLPALHAVLLDAYRPGVNNDALGSKRSGWANLPSGEPYIWDHLAYHLLGAGRREELSRTVKDLRYLAAKVHARGALAAEQDLTEAASCDKEDIELKALRRAFIQGGHLFNRLDNLNDIAATLLSRTRHIEVLHVTIERLAGGINRPYITPTHPLPDLPHPALVRTLTGHSNWVTGCAISADGKRAVSASRDKTVKVWDLESGREVFTLTGHSDLVNGCAISGDGRRVVSASDDKTVKVWDLEAGREVFTLTGHSSLVSGCAISADGKRAVSASNDNAVKVWDLETARALLTLTGHSSLVSGCAISGDGKRAASASFDRTVKVWDLETGRELLTLTGHSAWITGCGISPDGKRAVSASYDGTARVWDLETGRDVFTLTGHSSWVNGCAISADGKRAVSASYDGTARVWDLETGRDVFTLTGHSSWVNGCAISGDGKRAVSASLDGRVKVWDLETGWDLFTLSDHSSDINGCAVSANGKRAVSASHHRTVEVWDLATGQQLSTLTGHSSFVNGCAISGDGKRAVSASGDETVKVWDLEGGCELFALTGHSDSVNGCAISGDGKRAVSASSDETVKVWDLESGRELFTLTGHSHWANRCAMSGDGKRAVSASRDQTLKVWDLESGRELRTLIGHSDSVSGSAISADGERAASASWDQTVKVWDSQTGECLSTLAVDGHLWDCSMSPDGLTIVAAGARGVYFLKLVT